MILKQILWRHCPQSALRYHVHWFHRSEQHSGWPGTRDCRKYQLDVRVFYSESSQIPTKHFLASVGIVVISVISLFVSGQLHHRPRVCLIVMTDRYPSADSKFSAGTSSHLS